MIATEVEGFETKQHFRAAPEGPYGIYRSGDSWGCEFGNIWLKLSFAVPRESEGRALYMLNDPVQMFAGKPKKAMKAPVKISAENVICEAVKPAEDVENAYILRLYECERNKTATKLSFPDDVKEVFLTDMLERRLGRVALQDGTAQLTFKPFEIKTLLCLRG